MWSSGAGFGLTWKIAINLEFIHSSWCVEIYQASTRWHVIMTLYSQVSKFNQKFHV